jgi:hypothetical protein
MYISVRLRKLVTKSSFGDQANPKDREETKAFPAAINNKSLKLVGPDLSQDARLGQGVPN